MRRILTGDAPFRHLPYCVRCDQPIRVLLSDPVIYCRRCGWKITLAPKQYRRFIRTCAGRHVKHWQTIIGCAGLYWIQAGEPPRELLPGREMQTMRYRRAARRAESGVCRD